MLGVNNFLTHCKWLHTAVFNGHNPGYINQQIIQVDGHQWIHHKEICDWICEKGSYTRNYKYLEIPI